MGCDRAFEQRVACANQKELEVVEKSILHFV